MQKNTKIGKYYKNKQKFKNLKNNKLSKITKNYQNLPKITMKL